MSIKVGSIAGTLRLRVGDTDLSLGTINIPLRAITDLKDMSDLPDEAIDRLASAVARMLGEIGFEIDDVIDIEYEAHEALPPQPITFLDGLTARDVNCLARDGIRTISELTTKTPEYLHSIRNLGKIGANRIETALAARGLSLTGHTSLEARLREQIAQEIEVEMRYHDHQQIGFSAVGDAYAHAARSLTTL